MKTVRRCRIRIIPIKIGPGRGPENYDIVLKVTTIDRPPPQTGFYSKEMVSNHAAAVNFAFERGPKQFDMFVLFEPNRITILLGEGEAEKLQKEIEESTEAKVGAWEGDDSPFPRPGMSFLGHFTDVGPSLKHRTLGTSGRHMGTLAHQGCPVSGPGHPPPPGGHAHKDQLNTGQPSLEFVDALGRPCLALHFPLNPGKLICKYHKEVFEITNQRLSAEQTLVSLPFNVLKRPSMMKMHASHLSRHAFCGSPFRTNLTVASDLCNTQMIGGFERAVGPLVEKYSAPAGAFEATVAYIVESQYNPALALRFLIGTQAAYRVLTAMKSNGDQPNEAAVPGSVVAYRMACLMPVWEQRLVFLRRGDAWQEVHRQVYDCNALFHRAGDMVKGRFDISELTMAKGHASLAFLDRDNYVLSSDMGILARNHRLCWSLASCSPGAVTFLKNFETTATSRGLGTALQYLGVRLANAKNKIPVFSSGFKKIDAIVEGNRKILEEPMTGDNPGILLMCLETIQNFKKAPVGKRNQWIRELSEAAKEPDVKNFILNFLIPVSEPMKIDQ